MPHSRNVVLTCFPIFLILFAAPATGEMIGGLTAGAQVQMLQSFDNPYRVEWLGSTAGFLLPVHIPGLDVHYRVKAAYHEAEGFLGQKHLQHLIQASNTLLIGKRIVPHPRIRILPQIGLGAMGETAFETWGCGDTDGQFFLDFSLMTTTPLGAWEVGLLGNCEKGLFSGKNIIVSDLRLLLSVVVLR